MMPFAGDALGLQSTEDDALMAHVFCVCLVDQMQYLWPDFTPIIKTSLSTRKAKGVAVIF